MVNVRILAILPLFNPYRGLKDIVHSHVIPRTISIKIILVNHHVHPPILLKSILVILSSIAIFHVHLAHSKTGKANAKILAIILMFKLLRESKDTAHFHVTQLIIFTKMTPANPHAHPIISLKLISDQLNTAISLAHLLHIITGITLAKIFASIHLSALHKELNNIVSFLVLLKNFFMKMELVSILAIPPL